VSKRGAALLGVAALLSGCVYYNAIYNAERLYDEGERAHWAGDDSAASARYEEVIRKAADGYRREPRGEWADDALLLIGRANFRQGKLRAARAALEKAAQDAQDSTARLQALAYLGAVDVRSGDPGRALPLLNEALEGMRHGPVAAEAHLWRARALLEEGRHDEGWWDLDQVEVADPRLRVAAALERLRWGARAGDHLRVREAMSRLLDEPEAGQQVDSILTLVHAVAARWGPEDAAELLAHADAGRWERTDRGEVRLERARLLRAAGDTAAAVGEARDVAGGVGSSAVRARILLAHWQLERAENLSDMHQAVGVLLPAERDSSVAALLSRIDDVSRLSNMGLDDPLALFAAGELARDSLRAPRLAVGLFLAYADAAPDDPWEPKAVLAALEAAPSEGTRAWLRGRLEGRAGSPYVRAARGEPAPGFEALEAELTRRLTNVRRTLASEDSVTPLRPSGGSPGG